VRRFATPREIADWEEELASLAPERREAVVAMLSEVVGDCPHCEEPVRRCDGRRPIDGELYHLACSEGSG
jgi:hypothetical protein